MATSTVTLYLNGSGTNLWVLLPHKLLLVDSIDDYLETRTRTTINNFQYIKPELEISIKCDLSQTASEPLKDGYSYVTIKNSTDTRKYYYYVKKTVWRSKECVQFDLVMDVLNTFKENVDYTWKKNTKITREHKDRFFVNHSNNIMFFNMSGINEGELLSTGDYILIYDYPEENYLGYAQVISIDYGGETMWADIRNDYGITEVATPINLKVMKDIEGDDPVLAFYASLVSYRFDNKVYRNIDYVPENINPMLQCGKPTGNLLQRAAPLNVDWYLLYRNQNDPSESQATSLVNPVDCFLLPSEDLKCNSGVISGGRIRPSFVEDGKYYYFRLLDDETMTFSDGVTINGASGTTFVVICIFKTEGKLCAQVIYTISTDTNALVLSTHDDLDYCEINVVPHSYAKQNSYVSTVRSNIIGITYDQTFDNSEDTYNILDAVTNLDRTDAKNIKLIKLPYCPFNFTATGDVINTEAQSTWEYATFGDNNVKALKLKDLNTKLYGSWNEGTYQPLKNLLFNTSKDNMNPQITDTRRDAAYESKLYHSEFYRPTYAYDSFTFTMQLEKIDLVDFIDYYSPEYASLKFYVTSTINSKFMFEFTNYDIKYGEENYARYMPIARNNEEVLYNVPYINWIRTGYNYEVKNKNLQQTSSWLTVAGSAASLAFSFAVPTPPLKVAAVLGSLISLGLSIKSAIISTQQAENNLKSKIIQEKNQTASVAGSDDVDLMTAYASNRMKYLEYKPFPIMYSLLNDLFFYAGYNSGRMGLPNHNTRVNFDYLECDASIEKVRNIPDDCLEELIRCFKNGVTYLHKTNRASEKWDFDQKYENWELSILEEI